MEELYKKIADLENKLDYIINIMKTERTCDKKTKPDYTPVCHFQEWIKTFAILPKHLHAIFETTIMDGFKCCLDTNLDMGESLSNELPIWASNARNTPMYIFDEVEEWRPISTKDIHLIIETLWRKMLESYFMGEKTEESEEQRDINKKKLIDMRKKLVDKHSKTIEKYITSKLKN